MCLYLIFKTKNTSRNQIEFFSQPYKVCIKLINKISSTWLKFKPNVSEECVK